MTTSNPSSETIYFYLHRNGEPHGCFSNFFTAPFDLMVRGTNMHFYDSETAFMYHKALVMGDLNTARKILKSGSPREAKRLGRSVSPYDDKLWSEVKYDIMKKVVHAKFSQNPEFAKILKNTGNATLAEASRYDKCWGIGLCEEDAKKGVAWRGTNLLGKILMEVRYDLNKI